MNNANTTKSMEHHIIIYSLNTRGVTNNTRYIKYLLNDSDILFMSETWCNNKNELVEKLMIDVNEYKIIHMSERENDNENTTYGPGHCPGGIAFIINKRKMAKKEIKYNTIIIDERIILLSLNKQISIIGTYLPSNQQDQESRTEMFEEVEELNILMSEQLSNNKDIIIIGDQNCDIKRKNRHDKIFISMCEKHKLVNRLDDFDQMVDHTYFGIDNKSLIDNVMNNYDSEVVKEAIIIDSDPLRNSSDHHPIKITVDTMKDTITNINENINNKLIPIWDNETKLIFNNFLEKEHSDIQPISLADTIDSNICSSKISTLLTKLHTGMRKSMELISKENLEQTGKKFEISWTDEEDNAKIALKELKNIWKTNKSDEIKIKMKLAKKKLKHIREMNKMYVEEKMTSKLNKNFRKDNKRYWKQMDKLLQQKTNSEIDINTAKTIFEDLFNKQIMDDQNTDYTKLDEFISNNKNKKYNYVINDADLINIMNNLNTNCAVGFTSIPNECFKYGINYNTIKLIKQIIETFVNYDINPRWFNVGLIKIIVKDAKKDTRDPNNLRPITISDTIAIIFEKLMILEINKEHVAVKEQFGFKNNSSCEHAVFTLRELVRNNKRKNMVTILCALDASKAFDKVKRQKLWLNLIGKVQPYVIRALMNYYDQLKLIVNNNNEYSSIFGTSLGVKQGGPASPRLFTIYMEPLTEELNKLGLGIKVGDLIINHLMYADDVLIMADNIADLNRMLQVTSKFGMDFELKFNPSKTQFMICDRFRSKRKFDTPIFNNERLKRVYKIKYLGMHLNPELKTNDHLENKIKDSLYKMNQLKRCGFTSKFTITPLKINQYMTYVRPTLIYGSENQLLSKNEIKELQTTESTIIKKSFGFTPRYVKSSTLNRALNLDRISERLYLSKYKFIMRLNRNELTRKLLNELFKEPKSINDKDSLIGYINNQNKKLDRAVDQMLISMSNKIKNTRREHLKKAKNEEIINLQEALKCDKDDRKTKLAKLLLMPAHWSYNYYHQN